MEDADRRNGQLTEAEERRLLMDHTILHTDGAPQAIGPYSQAIRAGGMIYTSGQLGIDPRTGLLPASVEEQAHNAMRSIGAILNAAGLDMDHIVKTTIFLKDLSHFGAVNDVYESYFSGCYPARSCVQVAALPKGGLVEIECIAAV